VDFVAGRAELGRLLPVEGLEKRLAMRTGSKVEECVVGRTKKAIRTGRQIVQRRVLDLESALSHRAVDVRDRMAGGAPQARLRFRALDLVLHRLIETATEQQRVVVTPGTPLRGPSADHVLHVLDRFAVPLVVERRKVVHRRVPLLVNIAMAPAA
jgi:hypothetical protein